MYNVLISTGVAAALLLLTWLAGFGWAAAIIPSVLGFVAANILLARRVLQKVQALATAAQSEIQAQKFDKGVKLLEQGFQYDRWQFGVAGELHANIGLLQYMRREFDAAKPHLEKAAARGPAGARAKAMLACMDFNRKDAGAMSAHFEEAVKSGKKDAVLWAAYAWCLDQLDQRDAAIKVLARAVEENPSDEKLKTSLTQLQNEKKLKMKPYGLEWYQFHLEKPPMDMGPGGGRRVIFQRR